MLKSLSSKLSFLDYCIIVCYVIVNVDRVTQNYNKYRRAKIISSVYFMYPCIDLK